MTNDKRNEPMKSEQKYNYTNSTTTKWEISEMCNVSEYIFV